MEKTMKRYLVITKKTKKMIEASSLDEAEEKADRKYSSWSDILDLNPEKEAAALPISSVKPVEIQQVLVSGLIRNQKKNTKKQEQRSQNESQSQSQ
jgi:hypothetical protein